MKRAILLFLLPMLLFSCKDECESVICSNGGTCDDGTCICLDGYEGITCDEEKTPTAITIIKVEVTRYPETNEWSATTWDEDSAPDLFIYCRSQFFDENHAASSDLLIDYAGPAPVSFDLNFSMSLLSQEYGISLKDMDDNDTDQTLGSFWFVPYVKGEGFPVTKILGEEDDDVEFKIYLEYSF